MKTTKKLEKALTEIAIRTMCPVERRGSLETRRSDEEDFLDIAVWELREALLAAYELGRRDGAK